MPMPQPPDLRRESPAVFLDVDGTLVEIAERPDLVEVSAALRDTLKETAERVQGALAVVSGRSIADLDRILAPLQLPAAGIHGLEYRPAADARIAQVEAKPMPRAVREALERFAAEHPGLLVEYKGESAALHFRQAPELAERVQRWAEHIVAELGEDFQLQPGKMVVELRPAGSDKGAAIAALMDLPPFAGRRPLFIGDDVTDESGFEVVNALQGWSVRVGPEGTATAANFRLDNVRAVRDWLDTLATET
jgi:trehalose 6-phosphate phosphatase